MKRLIYSLLLLFMLSLMVFPPAVYASDPTYTPYDYLDEGEKTYVTNVRSWITVTKGRIETAQADLQTFFLQDYKTWYPAFIGELEAVNNGIAEINKISAHSSFDDVAQQCKALSGVTVEYAAMVLSPLIAPVDLSSTAQAIAGIDNRLTTVKNKLNEIWGSLDKRIEEIARAEKLGEEAIGKMLESCEFRPIFPY